MRFPFITALVGWCFVTYRLGLDLVDVSFGRTAALGLGTMLGVTVFGRMIMPEVFLALFLSATAYSFLRALRFPETSPIWWRVAWVLMGLGSLAKGFHAALWPLTVALICWCLGIWERRRWHELFQGSGPLLFLLMVIPWYLLIEWKYPGYLRENLWNEQVGHALDFRNPPTYQRVPLGTFLFQHLFLLFPAILWLPAILFRWRDCLSQFRDSREARFLIIWILVILVTSCFSARQDYYTMSLWAAVALWAAAALRAPLPKAWFLVPMIPPVLAGILCTFALKWSDHASGGGFRSDTSDQFLGILLNLPSTVLQALSWALLISAVTLIAGSIIGISAIVQDHRRLLPCSLGITMIGPLAGAAIGFQVLGDYFSLKRPAQVILASEPGIVVVDGPHQLASSLFYYLPQPIHFVRAQRNAEFATRVHGIGRDRYWEIEQFKKEWRSKHRIWFMIHTGELEFWKKTLESPLYEIPEGKAGERILLSNAAPQPLH